jgi:hypothetical protein
MSFKILTKEDYLNIQNKLHTFWELDSKVRNKIFQDLFSKYRFSSYEFGKQLGTPIYIDKDTENNQGVWIFKDLETDIIFVYYSDAYKSNHYKGGSFEFYNDCNVDSKIILKSFEDLLLYIDTKIFKNKPLTN